MLNMLYKLDTLRSILLQGIFSVHDLVLFALNFYVVAEDKTYLFQMNYHKIERG